jgi:hypothetical protein
MSKKDEGQATPEVATETPELTVGQQMSATLKKHRAGYKATKSASGNKSLDNGDPIATKLRGLAPEQVVALAQAILVPAEGETIPDLSAKYAHLNPGQRRMNAGNLIRNANKRGELSKTAIAAGIKAL